MAKDKKQKLGKFVKRELPLRRMKMTVSCVCQNCNKAIGTLHFGLTHRIFRCKKCEALQLAGNRPEQCVSCGAPQHNLVFVEHLSHKTKLSSGYCDDCQRIYGQMDVVVKEGGVYWKCRSCGSVGAWDKNHEIAKRLREQGLESPTLEINRRTCPVCSVEAIKARVTHQKQKLEELEAKAKERKEHKEQEKKKPAAEKESATLPPQEERENVNQKG